MGIEWKQQALTSSTNKIYTISAFQIVHLFFDIGILILNPNLDEPEPKRKILDTELKDTELKFQ